MTVRAVKVKGEQFSFLAHADSAEQLVTGAVTGETPTGWNFKVKGTYVHWVDDDGAERRKQGTLTGNSRTFGSKKVKGETIIYGDEDGNERSFAALAYVLVDTAGYNARIVRASDGRLWCVYDEGATLQSKYSDDNGLTWEGKEQITDKSNSDFDIAMLSTDEPCLVFTHSYTAFVRYIYFTYRDSSTGWAAVTEVGALNDYYYISMAVDSGDDVHIIYSRASYRGVRYKKRTSGVWGSEETVWPRFSPARRMCVVIDSSDDAHAVFSAHGGTGAANASVQNILYRKRESGVWQTDELVTDMPDDSSKDQRDPEIAIDSSGNLHVAWKGYGWAGSPSSHNALYRKKTGVSWGATVNLTEGSNLPGTTPPIRVTLDKDDDVYVLWQGYYKKYTSGAWGSLVTFDPAVAWVEDVAWEYHPTGGVCVITDGFYAVVRYDNDLYFIDESTL